MRDGASNNTKKQHLTAKFISFIQGELIKIKEQENYTLVLHFFIFIFGISLSYHGLYKTGLIFALVFLYLKRSIFFIFVLGITVMVVDFARHNQNLITKKYKNVQIEAIVENISHKERGVKYSLSHINTINRNFQIDGKLMAYCKKCNNIKITPHSKILATVEIVSLPKKVYPTGYDIANKYRFQGYSGFAFIKKIKVIESIPSKDLLKIPTRIRIYLINKLKLYSKNIDTQTIAIVEAVFLGEQSRISQHTNDILRKIGITHVISISGMHFSICVMIFYSILFRILAFSSYMRIHANIRKVSMVFSLFFAFFYLLIAGLPVPGLRSFFMIFFAVLIYLLNAKPKIFASVLFSGFVILLIAPHELLFASFQLSFLAVLFLGLIVDNSWKIKNLLMRYLITMGKSSLLISIVTTPVILYHFGGTSTIGPLVNIIAIPLFTFIIMPAGILFFILTITPLQTTFICSFLGRIMFETITQLLDFSNFFAKFDYSYIAVRDFSWAATLWILAGILIFFIIKSLLKLTGFIFIIIGIWIFVFSNTPDIIANDKSFVFRENGKYYIIGEKNDDFTRSIWQSKLGVKKDFLDGEKFCNDSKICITKRITFLKKNASIEEINNLECTEILVSRIELENMEKLKCNYTFIITKEALQGEPYVVLKYGKI